MFPIFPVEKNHSVENHWLGCHYQSAWSEPNHNCTKIEEMESLRRNNAHCLMLRPRSSVFHSVHTHWWELIHVSSTKSVHADGEDLVSTKTDTWKTEGITGAMSCVFKREWDLVKKKGYLDRSMGAWNIQDRIKRITLDTELVEAFSYYVLFPLWKWKINHQDENYDAYGEL